MHFAQLVHLESIIKISASFNSIASSGQTPTQHPQKSHLPGIISIINLPFFACLYSIDGASLFKYYNFDLNGYAKIRLIQFSCHKKL